MERNTEGRATSVHDEELVGIRNKKGAVEDTLLTPLPLLRSPENIIQSTGCRPRSAEVQGESSSAQVTLGNKALQGPLAATVSVESSRRDASADDSGSPPVASEVAETLGERGQIVRRYGSPVRIPEQANILEDTVSPKRNRKGNFVSFGAATIRELTEHTLSKLERSLSPGAIVITIFITFTACIVVLLLVVLWPEPAGPDLEPCVSRLCQKALKYLDDASSPHVPPCDDFYAHVCYKWTRRGNESSFFSDSLQNMYSSLNYTLLMKSATLPDRYGMEALRSLYNVCYTFMTDNSRRALTDIMAVFQEENEILRMQNSSELIMRLTEFSIAKGMDSVFRLDYLTEGERRLFTVTSGQPLSQRFGEKSLDGNLMLYLSQIIADILGPTPNVTDVIQAVLDLDFTMQKILTQDDKDTVTLEVRDLALLTPHLTANEWIAKINLLLQGRSVVRGTDPLITRGFNATVKMLSALDVAEGDSRLLYLYIQVIAEVLKFDYHRRYKATHEVPQACLKATENVLTHTWSHLIAQLSMGQYEVREISVLFDRIINTLLRDSYTSWMDSTALDYAKAFLRGVHVRAFSIARMPLDIGVDYSSTRLIIKNNFPKSYIALLANAKKVLLKVPPHVSLMHVNRAQFNGFLKYIDSIHTLVVPTASSLPPILYPKGIPSYFNFGTVGSLVAMELSSKIGPYPRGRRNPRWTNGTFNSIAQVMECLRRQRSFRLGGAVSRETVHGEFVWARSVRVAYDTMMNTRAGSDTAGVGGNWDGARRTFFKRFCLVSCGASTGALAPRLRCNLPLMNMPEFASAFGCASGKTMTPLTLCRIL